MTIPARRIRVSVRGVGTHEAARAAVDAGADAVALVLTPNLAGYINPARAYEIMAVLPPLVSSVGVVAGVGIDEFCDIEEACPTTLTQFVGDEDESLVRRCGPGVVRAIPTAGREEAAVIADLRRWAAIDEVDAVLLELAPGAVPGGLLVNECAEAEKPVFIGGPLDVGDIARAAGLLGAYAVELNADDGSDPAARVRALLDALARV